MIPRPLLLVLVAASSLRAAEPPDLPPPHLPLVASPVDAQWTISARKSLDVPNPPPVPGTKPEHLLVEVRCAKTGQTKREILVYADGQNQEYWYVGSVELVPGGPGQPAAAVDLSRAIPNPEGGVNLQGPGFVGIDWISLGNYDAVTMAGKLPCYHYVLRGSEGTEAWIDAKTGFPVAFRANGAYYVYTFTEPSELLSLPAAYRQSYDAYKKLLDRRKQLEAGN